jgi:hypothetical protein
MEKKRGFKGFVMTGGDISLLLPCLRKFAYEKSRNER